MHASMFLLGKHVTELNYISKESMCVSLRYNDEPVIRSVIDHYCKYHYWLFRKYNVISYDYNIINHFYDTHNYDIHNY